MNKVCYYCGILNAGENMKEQRIIINSFGVDDPMRYVKLVIDQGMLSKNGTCYSYSYATRFKDDVFVTCAKLKKGFAFRVYRIEKE